MVLIPAKMGRINKRALVGRLQRDGEASRADLAKSLGLSQPTAGKIADELLRLGVLEELEEPAAAGRGRVGRPGRILRLNRSQPRFVAIQLGVSQTNLAALPVGLAADPGDRWEVRVPTPQSADGWGQQLRHAAAKIPSGDFWGALVSAPGIVDEAAGRILFSPNLHWTEGADLPALVEKVWPIPVALVQEERALALGHQCSGPSEEDFLLVDFGEGVGGAAILGGKLYTNTLPLSGEIGHTPVLGNDRRCGCGAVGCLETLVSMRGLLQSAAAQGGMVSDWNDLSGEIASQGLPEWLAATLDKAAVVIAGALNVLGLRRVVITGILRELPACVMTYLSNAVRRGMMWARFGDVSVENAPRRRAAGLVAVGIDRFALPMEVRRDSARDELPPARAHAKGGSWLSYDE